MHPVMLPELVHQHRAELLADAERRRLVTAVRRPRTRDGGVRRRAAFGAAS